MFGLGAPELLIILGIMIVIFGAGKVADIGGALGKSIREFRQATEAPGTPEVAAKVEEPSR